MEVKERENDVGAGRRGSDDYRNGANLALLAFGRVLLCVLGAVDLCVCDDVISTGSHHAEDEDNS